MEQSIHVAPDQISTNKTSKAVEHQQGKNDSADGENIDINGAAPFLQLLNQQITLMTPAGDSANMSTNTISEKTLGDSLLGQDQNINGFIKQNLIPAMVDELSGMKEVLSGNGSAPGKIDSDFLTKLQDQISGIGVKESLQEMERNSLFKNDDKNTAIKLSDQLLKDNNLKIPDNQSMRGSGFNLSTSNLVDKSGSANIDLFQTLSANIDEKLKSLARENNISGDKNSQDISSNSLSAANNVSAKINSIDEISSGQIINRVVSEIKGSASNDGGRVKITLNPPSLGTLEMDVTVRNNKVEVIIVADNKDVQQSLNSHLDRLRGSLHSQGLTIDRCDVLMQNNREGYQQNFSQQTFYRDGSEKNHNTSKEKYSEEIKHTTKLQPQILNIPSINLDNISIFA